MLSTIGRRGIARGRLLVAAWAVAITATANAAGKAPAPAPPPKPLRFSCADALPDGTLIDPHQEASLIALAARLQWKGDDPYGPPADCHRAVRLLCGPDLDHDGDADAIIEVSWRFTDDCPASQNESGDFVPVTKVFLASRHGSEWRAVAPLAITTGDEPSSAFFVRRRGGETAIRVEWRNAANASGCSIGRYEVFALRAGALRQVESGDDSRTCVPCGCK